MNLEPAAESTLNTDFDFPSCGGKTRHRVVYGLLNNRPNAGKGLSDVPGVIGREPLELMIPKAPPWPKSVKLVAIRCETLHAEVFGQT